MREGGTVNENETVNESKSQTAAGSGNSPEKLVADFVESSWDHITENGFDKVADAAVDMLVKNGSVPSDAYLHAVKTSWCLHRAAVHYARQHGVERAAADRARGDAQFEHSHRAQAERKAEKLEADLAQSVLLVENHRLRMEELQQKLETAEAALLEQQQQKRAQCIEAQNVLALWGETRRRCEDLQTANEATEAALLEQQQRNEELVTRGSQQRMRIAELEKQLREKQATAGGGLLRDVSHYTDMAETDATEDVVEEAEPQPVQVREGRWRTRGGDIRNVTPTPEDDDRVTQYPWYDAEYDQTWASNGRCYLDEEHQRDLVQYLGPIEPEAGSEQIAS